MVVESATKTEVVLAVALYRGYNATEVALFDRTIDGVLAIGGRTPFEVYLIINVCPL
jgi:hypothetical protein